MLRLVRAVPLLSETQEREAMEMNVGKVIV